MKITIVNHDSSKRYKIQMSYGGIHKTLWVPIGMVMPIAHNKDYIPDGSHVAGFVEEVIGDSFANRHPFSFTISGGNDFKYDGFNVQYSNEVKLG